MHALILKKTACKTQGWCEDRIKNPKTLIWSAPGVEPSLNGLTQRSELLALADTEITPILIGLRARLAEDELRRPIPDVLQ